MGVETDNQEGFKDIVKAAGDFASRVGSGKGVDKEKIHKGKGKRYSSAGTTSQIKSKSKGNPKGTPKGVESPQSQTKKMEIVTKSLSPGKTMEKNTSKGGRHGKKWFEMEKTTARRMAAKQKKGQK